MKKFKNVTTFDRHALIQHHMSLLRDKRTGQKEFNDSLKIITMLMAGEITRSLPAKRKSVETPLERTDTWVLSGKPPAIVGILRAGFGMVDPLRDILRDSPVGHIGMSRNHDTLQPEVEGTKLPDVTNRLVILAETMLATGGSASKGIEILKDKGATNIIVVGLVAAPQGIRKIQTDHAGIKIYTAALDRTLNKKGYILPGLGDAGDRIFGTIA